MGVYIYQSGTEKSLKNAYIGEYGWHPGANTIAYFPLKDDISDHVGNFSITTKTGQTPSKQTIGYNFTGRATVVLGNNVDRTLSMWIKIVSASTTGVDHYIEIAQLQKYNIQYQYYHGSNSSLSQNYLSFTDVQYNVVKSYSAVSQGTWYHFCSVADTDNNKMYGYINGTKVFEYSGLGYDFGFTYEELWLDRNSSNVVQNGVATLSECIIENKARTAQEVADYYNSTKANYGL